MKRKKYLACFSIVLAMWCYTANSAESKDADTQRRERELKEKIDRQPPLDQASIKAYAASINRAVQRHVVFPLGSGGQRCDAAVTQDKSGKVVELQVLQCESKALASAIQAAVHAASPLPLPADMRYFIRNLRLVFVAPDGR